MDATEKPNWPSRRRVVLLRHGDVSYFDEAGLPYNPEAVGLNDDGRAQAVSTGLELADLPFDRVVCSDLPRCVETATLVTTGRELPLEKRPELREIRPGRLTDIPANKVQDHFLGAFRATLDRDTRFLGGETFGSLLGRVLPCFQALLQEQGWRCLLVVAHGGVNRAFLCHALGLDLSGFAGFEQDPCCINIVDVDDRGRYLVRLINHTSYNPAKIGLNLTTMERLYQDYERRQHAREPGPEPE